jgi:hypothetical protein
MPGLLLRAWLLAEAAARQLSSPPTDRGAADREVHQVVVASRLFHAAEATRTMLQRAWRESRLRGAAQIVAAGWPDSGAGERLRRTGACMATAAVTVFLLQLIETGEDAPFRWILPVVFAVTGAAMALAADAIARAWKDKHR